MSQHCTTCPHLGLMADPQRLPSVESDALDSHIPWLMYVELDDYRLLAELQKHTKHHKLGQDYRHRCYTRIYFDLTGKRK